MLNPPNESEHGTNYMLNYHIVQFEEEMRQILPERPH